MVSNSDGDYYSDELERLFVLDSPVALALFYHGVSYKIWEQKVDTITEPEYADLCRYLLDHFAELPAELQRSLNKEDLESENCALVSTPVDEFFKPGKHFLQAGKDYLDKLIDVFDVDFFVERWNVSPD